MNPDQHLFEPIYDVPVRPKVHPADIYTHKSKTFKKNKCKGK